MENFFSIDGKFFRFINKFTSLISLNFLFIITSLPIITIGVSFYALYQTNLKLSQNTESYIARTYFFFWEKILKQNILLWLPVTILFIFCLINLYILPFMPETFFRSLTLCIQFLILLLLQGFLIYAFSLPDQYRTTLKHTVKNAVILTFKYLPATFLCICINALPVSISLLLPKITGYVLAAFIIIGFSGISFLHTFILQLLLKKENLFGNVMMLGSKALKTEP